MEDFLMWTVIICLFIKMMIQLSIGSPKKEIFGRYFFLAQNSFLALLPIKKGVTTKGLTLIGNCCLILFYLTLFLLCLIVYIRYG